MRVVLWVVLGHVALFLVLANRNPLPKVKKLSPGFSVRERKFEDPETGERMVVREITVSTKLAPATGPERE